MKSYTRQKSEPANLMSMPPYRQPADKVTQRVRFAPSMSGFVLVLDGGGRIDGWMARNDKEGWLLLTMVNQTRRAPDERGGGG